MNVIDVFGPFVVLVVIIFVVVVVYLRQGRNHVLEKMIAQREGGALAAFRGTLSVEESRPSFLRLCKSTAEARNLQFQYRWLVGKGRQAIFDEVTFDAPRHLVELKRKGKSNSASFSEFAAVRMREVSGKYGISIWHVELIPRKGTAIPFVTSDRGYRETSFERTAPLAQVVSAIMSIPVHVVVDGGVWTPGWPPKEPTALS
jgi:hypothetical protein